MKIAELTKREAKEQYQNFFIGFVLLENNETDPDFSTGYVLFNVPTYEEALKKYKENKNSQALSIIRGYNVMNTSSEVGGIEVTWQKSN